MSDERSQSGKRLPTFTTSFGSRLNEVINLVGGRKNAASIADISVDQLDKWRDGRSKMPLFAALALCDASGKSIAWLVGQNEGPSPTTSVGVPASTDPELFGRVVDRITRVYKDEHVQLQPVDLGRIAAEQYDQIRDLGEDPEEWPALLDLMAVRLRRTIRASLADPANVKREA